MLAAGQQDYKALRELMAYDSNLKEHNIEQLSAKLLFDLTRNTGFEISKGNIGDCWLESCCNWTDRQSDDLCGLDDDKLSAADKMRSIYIGTSLKTKLSDAGLETLSC